MSPRWNRIRLPVSIQPMFAALFLLRGPQPFVPDVIGDDRYAVVEVGLPRGCDLRRMRDDRVYLDLALQVTPEGTTLERARGNVFVEHGADPAPLHQAIAAFVAEAPQGAVLAEFRLSPSDDTDLQTLILALEFGHPAFERVVVGGDPNREFY